MSGLIAFSGPIAPWRDRLVAESPAMQALLDLVAKVAPSKLRVLLHGETGSGKEVIARALHEASGRTGAFIAVNCAALPAALVESELFGHTKGAFTGASEARRGLFVEADNGTILLDEVAELELPVQAKLLRVLEDGLVRPVGSNRMVATNARVIAATHQDLGAAVRAQRFREDLFFRLAGVTLAVPPLRNRPDDIPPLLERFIASEGGGRSLAPEALEALARYPWPGNVRELRLAVERAIALGGPVLAAADFLLPELTRDTQPHALPELTPWQSIERFVLESAMAHSGSIRAAARTLGLPKSTVADRVHRHGLTRPR